MMTIILRLLAVLSFLAAIVGMGLSAMAADDVSRAAEAQRLQLLVAMWLAVSIATPIVSWIVARTDERRSRLVYITMPLLAIWAIIALASF